MDFTGIIGPRGSGKTTVMTMLAGTVYLDFFKKPRGKKKKTKYGIALMEHHRVDFKPMWSLVKKIHPHAALADADQIPTYYIPNDLRRFELKRMEYKIIFWDDLQNLFDLRNRDLVPPNVRLFLATVRHHHSQIIYSCPHWSRADKDLRLGTGRLLKIGRWWRILMVKEYAVKPDETDPLGANVLVKAKTIFPHLIWLPFTPEDEVYPLRWGWMRKVAKFVGEMFDSWAMVDVGEHVLDARKKEEAAPPPGNAAILAPPVAVAPLSLPRKRKSVNVDKSV